MPLLLPPFGRGGGGSGLPPRLQSHQQDTELSTGVNKRPAYLPHAPGGRGIRLNWNRQPPGYSNGMAPRDRRLDSPEAGFTGSKTLERMSSKGSSNSSTDGEMPMPSGCPLPTAAFTAPPPPPPPTAPVPSGPLHNGLAPSPFLFPPPANVSQTQVPFSPYLVVPHVDSSAPINVNAKSSADPSGSDLPMNDIATLRFFFNLGLEYYRLCMLFQLQQQQQYAAFLGSHQLATAAAGPAQPLDGAIYVGDLEDIQGQSSSKESPSNSDKTVKKDKQKAEKPEEKIAEPEASATASKGGSAEKSGTKGTVESAEAKEETVNEKDGESKLKVSLPSHCEDTAVDSGCASDVSTDGCVATDECYDASRLPCLFDNHSDNSDSQSNIPADSHSDSSSQHSTSNMSVLSSSGSDCSSISSLPYQKPYHTPLRTRNSPKLLKPLKDIPPRFQKMLSCNPAIRQDQFEGQPIMRQAFHGNGHHQHKPKSVVVSANNLSDLPTYHSFNPHAESFVPRSSSLVSTNPCSSTNSSSCTRSSSSSSMYSTCPSSSDVTGVPPSECCSTSSSESGSAGVGDGSVVSWTVPPPPTGQNSAPVSGPIAPTYTIHIHSAGCTIEPAQSVCSLSGNHCVSAATPAGSSYTVSNALPAAPANTYMTQDPSAAAHNVVPSAAPVPTAPAPPSAPPGGIVYYCQQQQQQQQPQHPESYTYSATTYTVPAPQGNPQYVYTTPTGYQSYETYAYS